MSKPMIWMFSAAIILMLGGVSSSETPESTLPLFFGIALDGYPVTGESLSQVRRDLGISPQIVVFYLQWPESPAKAHFPKESLDFIWSYGSIPCISWEPMTCQGTAERMIPFREIIEGRYDPYLKSFAEAARRWKKPFIIRFAHEMNTMRYHWGTTLEAFGSDSPEIYRLIFKYVVNFFRREGANNVLWAFCPNAESVPDSSYQPDARWNEARNYYPGDRFVDILGMDGYNWGSTQTREKSGWDSRWQSFREIFSNLHEELRSIAPGKPLMVFETSSVGEPDQLTIWLREALATLHRWQVRGLVWFQVNKEVDWRIDVFRHHESARLIHSQTSCCAQTWLTQFAAERRRQTQR